MKVCSPVPGGLKYGIVVVEANSQLLGWSTSKIHMIWHQASMGVYERSKKQNSRAVRITDKPGKAQVYSRPPDGASGKCAPIAIGPFPSSNQDAYGISKGSAQFLTVAFSYPDDKASVLARMRGAGERVIRQRAKFLLDNSGPGARRGLRFFAAPCLLSGRSPCLQHSCE